jgi:hypothetical protein
MLSQIVIEAETPGDLRTMFRLRINASVIAEDLTEVQAELLVGEILERIALPRSVAGPASGGLLGALMRIVVGSSAGMAQETRIVVPARREREVIVRKGEGDSF